MKAITDLDSPFILVQVLLSQESQIFFLAKLLGVQVLSLLKLQGYSFKDVIRQLGCFRSLDWILELEHFQLRLVDFLLLFLAMKL